MKLQPPKMWILQKNLIHAKFRNVDLRPLSFLSCWWRLLAAAESWWVPGDGQRRGLPPLLPHLPRHVRPLPHNLRLPPHQDAQTEAKRDSGEGGETPQGPAAPAATATPAKAPCHHQGHEPEACCCCCCKTGEEGVMMMMMAWFRHPSSLDSCLFSSFKHCIVMDRTAEPRSLSAARCFTPEQFHLLLWSSRATERAVSLLKATFYGCC